MAVKTFAVGEVLTASDTNTYLANAGLVYITSTTVGSGVSSVTVSNCFSSTYDNYRIVYTGGTQSSNTQTALRLGSSTTGYSGSIQYVIYTGGAAPAQASDNNGDKFTWAGGGDSISVIVVCDLFGPYATAHTRIAVPNVTYSILAGTYAGIHGVSTSYTGFTILPGSGTLTGGTITVYGYRKA